MSANTIRLINTSREVLEFTTLSEAYDFVLSLDPPMVFRTNAPEAVCIPMDPESSPEQLEFRTYAILPLTDKEKKQMRDKLRGLVNEMKQGVAAKGMTESDAEIIAALAAQAENAGEKEQEEDKKEEKEEKGASSS